MQINTMDGFVKITDNNGSGLICCDSYAVDENGKENFEGIERLTLSDVAKRMKELDGCNHDLCFVYRYQVELTDATTGATSPIDVIELPDPIRGDSYTAEDYRENCRSNGVEWAEGEITFSEIEN